MKPPHFGHPQTFTNPIYPHDFPDPFVLRFNGRYYAYGTGGAGDGRFFPMLTSKDLVNWEPQGGALEPLELPGAEVYWAPEVAYREGRFYLYYATGRDADPDHHLRLATADHPLGPWRDAGLNLTPHEIFAIDAHPFRDPADGRWYLFYARDELEPPFAGTGIVVDRLLAMDRLEGKPRRVVRPSAAWQVFELQRAVKKGLDWYTVEGPYVVRVGARYVCFYSGGRWENPNYGVSFAVADHPLGPWMDRADEQGPVLLTTVPGRVIGPGHNSVVVAPDLITQYLVYHGWDPACAARLPRLDRLEWNDGRPQCDGPSWEPRPAPPWPDVVEWFDEEEPGSEWRPSGSPWRREAGGLLAPERGAVLALRTSHREFVAEVSARTATPDAAWGVQVGKLEVVVEGQTLRAGDRSVSLSYDFRCDAWHLLTIRRQSEWLMAELDGHPRIQVPSSPGPAAIGLRGDAGAQFSHFALTAWPRTSEGNP